jgi:hypothetical protein
MADRDPHDDRFRGEGPKRYEPRPWRRTEDQDRFPPERKRHQSYDPCLDQQMEDRGGWRGKEDCADAVSGVEHVQNNPRVSRPAGTAEERAMP